ncbi:uncharacterized protein CCR75_007146 [Bremia lactucae]|uniref:RRM domain-containing protein n=1 Tax=Bremia lactucae TaxID=4779 RepID=A0A976FHF0_BRELC|nr:hypothetical protein CCR75_007146 [Bremia lactucae]
MSVKDEEQVLVAMEESCRIYVGNLVPKAKEVHLTSKFARFGTIHSIWIARKPPGFAFVRFDNSDAAHRAVKACQEIGGILIAGKAVRVEMAGDKERKHYKGSAKQQEVNKNDIVKTTLQYAIMCNQYGFRQLTEGKREATSKQGTSRG